MRLPDFVEGQHPRDAFGKFAHVATGDRAAKLLAMQQAYARRRKMTAEMRRIRSAMQELVRG